MLPGDCCLQAKPSRRAERRGARGSSGRRGARSHVLRGSWGRAAPAAPPEGKILVPPTGCPGTGPGEGQEPGSSTRGFGHRVRAVPGHGAAPGPPGVIPQPRGPCPGSCPHSPRIHFPFTPISGDARSRWNRGEGSAVLLPSAPVRLCLAHDGRAGTVAGWERSPRLGAGMLRDQPRLPALGWQGHAARRCPTQGGDPAPCPETQDPSRWHHLGGKGHKNPAAAQAPLHPQRNCSLPQSLSGGTAPF